MKQPKDTSEASLASDSLPGGNEAKNSIQLQEKAHADIDTVLNDLGSQADGLSEAEARSRLKQHGTTEIARVKHQSAAIRLLANVKNPLVILLLALGVLSFLTGDLRATVVIFVMVVLGVALQFFQEIRAITAAEKLQAMVSNTATLVRGGRDLEAALKMVVPGYIIRLAAGVLVPADARIFLTKICFSIKRPLLERLCLLKKSRTGIGQRSKSIGTSQYLFFGFQRGEWFGNLNNSSTV